MSKVYVIGTCDTKFDELSYAKELIEKAGVEAVLVDVGTRGKGGAVGWPVHPGLVCPISEM
jgi:uncharacterized protein (UPF0261 family)